MTSAHITHTTPITLITGGSRGLGAAIAQVLGESGMRVVLAGGPSAAEHALGADAVGQRKRKLERTERGRVARGDAQDPPGIPRLVAGAHRARGSRRPGAGRLGERPIRRRSSRAPRARRRARAAMR